MADSGVLLGAGGGGGGSRSFSLGPQLVTNFNPQGPPQYDIVEVGGVTWVAGHEYYLELRESGTTYIGNLLLADVFLRLTPRAPAARSSILGNAARQASFRMIHAPYNPGNIFYEILVGRTSANKMTIMNVHATQTLFINSINVWDVV